VKWIWIILLCALPAQALDLEKSKEKEDEPDLVDDYFHTHITSGVSSIRPWHVAYQRFPGAAFSDHFLLNSLSMGATDYLNFGTVPLMYFSPSQVFNANVKVLTPRPTLYGNHRLYFSFGYSTFIYHFAVEPFYEKDRSITSSINLSLDFYSGNVTWVTLLEWLSLALEIGYTRISSSSETLNGELGKSQIPIDVTLDSCFRLSPDWFYTLGLGSSRTSAFEIVNATQLLGFGNSVAWMPRYHYLTSLSAGVHYFPSAKRTHFLIGASF
jgi:hypothetical protein